MTCTPHTYDLTVPIQIEIGHSVIRPQITIYKMYKRIKSRGVDGYRIKLT